MQFLLSLTETFYVEKIRKVIFMVFCYDIGMSFSCHGFFTIKLYIKCLSNDYLRRLKKIYKEI